MAKYLPVALFVALLAVTNGELYQVEFDVQLAKGKTGSFVMEVRAL